MKRRILITGGAGYIGSRLATMLAARGDWVRVLDTGAGNDRLPDSVERVTGSILDRKDLARAMTGIDVAFHLAAVAHLWLKAPERFDEVNHQGTRCVLEAAARAKVKRIVATNTALVLRGWDDPSRAPVSEDEPRPPIGAMPGPYSRSKWRADQAAREAIADGLPVVVLYPAAPVGGHDPHGTPPTKMLKQFLSDPPPVVLDCPLNFLHVDDIASAHLLAAAHARDGARYVIGDGYMRMRQVLAVLEETTGRPMPTRHIPYWMAAAAAHGAEAFSRLTGNAPVASVEGVRAAKFPRDLDGACAKRDLRWRPRSAEEAVARAARAMLTA